MISQPSQTGADYSIPVIAVQSYIFEDTVNLPSTFLQACLFGKEKRHRKAVCNESHEKE